MKVQKKNPTTKSSILMDKHPLVDILNLPNTNGQWFLLISSFDVIYFLDSFRVLGQAGQAIDGVRGHGNYMALLQRFLGPTQDFVIIVVINIFNSKKQGTT